MIKVRPKVEGLVLRSGEIVGPGHEVTLQIDEAYDLFTRGLAEIIPEDYQPVEFAVKNPSEVR